MYMYIYTYIYTYTPSCTFSQRADNWLGATAFTFIAGVAGNNSQKAACP